MIKQYNDTLIFEKDDTIVRAHSVKINKITYKVRSFFNTDSKETAEKKLFWLLEQEAEKIY